MPLDFEKYAMKGNEFVNLLAKNLGDDTGRARAGRILRSVFRTLRNHLTLEESSDLLAQLPMAVKSVYVEGWRISQPHERIRTIEAFAAEVIKEQGQVAWRDFSSLDEVIQSVRAVIETMVAYISADEMEEAFGTLPKNLRSIFSAWVPS
jgi:uncharacterized protein (DUF2267 family)